jgi:beta-galactosidase beta subunit
MILGRLDQKCVILDALVQHKRIWKICFNWLRDMPKGLPFGQYKIDHQNVTALYCQNPTRYVEGNVLYPTPSVAQIHYVVEGEEELCLVFTEENSPSQSDVFKKKEGYLKKAVINQRSGDFIILFPSQIFQAQATVIGDKPLKKIRLSIPIQRLN